MSDLHRLDEFYLLVRFLIMVTVIADKDELTTPVNNGVTADSNDNERPYQYIKDYQEVNFIICLLT